MSIESPPTGEPRKTKKGIGVWSSLLYFAGVAALVAGIYWVAPVSSNSAIDVEAAATDTTTTTTVNLVLVESPGFILGEEPIADAADVILPSVVHIETSAGLGSGV
ncbi:MAG: hypothetical protein O6853_07745, partial [Actinobacteria bacterium]|nr:hypothetical protein [Actinomycetota bacterium]